MQTDPSVESFLARPLDQRVREHKYRCAQALVFGLPVIALHYFGARLSGGANASRWAGALEALLTGWVLCIGATGMISEGIVFLLARRRVTSDLIVAAISVIIYAWSLAAYFFDARMEFHLCIALLAGWSGLRWAMLRRHSTSGANL